MSPRMARAPEVRRSWYSLSHALPRNEVQERVLAVVKGYDRVDPEAVGASSMLRDLGLDSLDVTELVLSLEEEFKVEIPSQQYWKLGSIEETINFFSNCPTAK
uniref:Acyl carrier protein n=1 Tax=Arcella intermedia TaxID=1963864 RepID=A0A6B2LT27_9EUKA